MGKSDDSILRRKNKKHRKKEGGGDSSKVSSRVAAIIAAKKRRKSGKRRLCQGMCFSLPTPDDPFNDTHGTPVPVKKRKKPPQSKKKLGDGPKRNRSSNGAIDTSDAALEHQSEKLLGRLNHDGEQILSSENAAGNLEKKIGGVSGNDALQQTEQDHSFESHFDSPSKFLVLCLKTIQEELQNDATLKRDVSKPLFLHQWGIEFWKCISNGKDVWETNGADSSIEQIAWMTATAADTISRKEKEGLSFPSPFLLFLVPSQEKAIKVRQVCKPLKALGIHTVSLHPGASIDRQIIGLERCEPEFLISTPERLQELISLKAIDISGVSLLILDGLKVSSGAGYLDAIKSTRQLVATSAQTVVFSDYLSDSSVPALQELCYGSFCRLSVNNDVKTLQR